MFCNDDIRFPQDNWLSDMVGIATLDDAAWVQPRILLPSGNCQCLGVYIGDGTAGELFRDLPGSEIGMGGYAHSTHAVGACTAALSAIEVGKFKKLGGFPEDFPLDFNDVVACWKATKAGLSNYLVATADVLHGHSMSRMKGLSAEARMEQLRGALVKLKETCIGPDITYPESLRIASVKNGFGVAGLKMDLLRWWEPPPDAPARFLLGSDMQQVTAEVRKGNKVFVGIISQAKLHMVNPRVENQEPIGLDQEDKILDLMKRLRVTQVIACPLQGEETVLPDVVELWNKGLATVK